MNDESRIAELKCEIEALTRELKTKDEEFNILRKDHAVALKSLDEITDENRELKNAVKILAKMIG